MPKTKIGEQINWKEFFKRWKSGIEGITPLQQTKTSIWGTRIMVIGILCGIVICIIGIKNLWWLLIILIGALFNTTVQYLGLWQKKILLERVEQQMEGGEFEMEETEQVELPEESEDLDEKPDDLTYENTKEIKDSIAENKF